MTGFQGSSPALEAELSADEVGGRDTGVVEEQFGGASGFLADLVEFAAGGVAFDGDQADALVAGGGSVFTTVTTRSARIPLLMKVLER